MDFLDSQLHLSILTALASNLASSSTHDDLSLLTDSFSSREPLTNGLVNGVLARLTTEFNGTSSSSDPITTQQANGIISFAEFSAQATPSTANLDRVLAILGTLPSWDVEASLGLQASTDWAPSDRLSYSLTAAVLKLAAGGAGERRGTLAALTSFHAGVLKEIDTSPGHRIIGHLLPALNGFRRAVAETPFAWSLSDAFPSSTLPTGSTLSHVASVVAQDWDVSSEEGRISLASLQQYESSLKGWSPAFLSFATLECQQAYLASGLSSGLPAEQRGWKALSTTVRERSPPSASARDALRQVLEEALGLWDTTLMLLEDESQTSVDPYSFDVLLQSLKVATLSCIASDAPDARISAILEGIVSEASRVTDETLQSGAIECLQALAYAFPALVPQSAKLVRRFILSPSAVFEQDSDLTACGTLRTAAEAYASFIILDQDAGLQLSAIQSLFNHFTVSDPLQGASNGKASDSQSIRSASGSGLARTELQKRLVSSNIAHAVSILVHDFADSQICRFAVSMLLQRLGGTDPIVDGAIMIELAELTRLVDAPTFIDIMQALSVVSKASVGDQMGQAVLTAQTKMATVAAGRLELHDFFLLEHLSLFVDKGVQEATPRGERTSSLLALLPILDTFLVKADLDPRRDFVPNIIALFRSMWYLCVMSGFLSPSSKLVSDWQRSVLARIAKQTPGLLDGAGDDFIETELEYNSVLRRSNYTISPDTIRAELAAAVPQQAGSIRTLSTPQAVFLTAVLRLESLRAEAGQPATILTYFHVEGINNSAMFSILCSIADQVNNAFIVQFSELVTQHAINQSIYSEVCDVLLECCHYYAKVRSVSIRYLNDLISSFPSLLCEATVVNVLLEILTVLRRACQAEFVDEYTPVYTFRSARGGFSLVLPDDYVVRNAILSEMHQYAKAWLKAGITRAQFEMQGLLQDYIDGSQSVRGEHHLGPLSDDEMGKSVAIDMVRSLPSNAKEASLPRWGGWKSDNSAHFARTFGNRSYYGGDASHIGDAGRQGLIAELQQLAEEIRSHKLHSKLADLRPLFYRCAAHLVNAKEPDVEILHHMVALPVRVFSDGAVTLAQEVWTWVSDTRPDLEARLMVEVAEAWTRTVQHKQGLFSTAFNRRNPLDQETQFTPTDKDAMTQEYTLATRSLHPHAVLLSFLSSRFQAFRYRDQDLVLTCMRLLMRSSTASATWSTHSLARELRMRLLSFGFCVLQGSKAETAVEFNFRTTLYDAALSWFAIRAGWSFGTNRIQLKADLQAVEELRIAIKTDAPSYNFVSSSSASMKIATLPGRLSLSSAIVQQNNRQHLLLTLLDSEDDRLRLWINPLSDPARGPVAATRTAVSEATWRQTARIAWTLNPTVAVHLPERFKVPALTDEVTRLVRSDPGQVEGVAEALGFFVGETITADIRHQLRHLLYWAPVPVISALRFLFPKFGGDPVLLQYALRVLEHHPVEVTFFYIPQVVQALRTDALGYAERFIFETSKISQLFCHQIIWNMKANAYRGDAGEEADPMKPTLDRMVEMIVESLSGEAKDFFLREFAFFDEVTSISAKLKPFIKASKLEKKAKIDEEMAKIKVDPGVYLPSNPDGVVVDIDRTSGRPLQSHAKAPFMATFKVRREKNTDAAAQEALIELEESSQDAASVAGFDTWQSAIFKVGDDCRQDVLALQIIAMHKNIFTSLGLDLLVTPYRVTATGPGCGVIDVIPNATSRDEMGRAKVNDLRSFFILKYGSPDGVHFQKARTNFIQSMAAYSLLCYIVQIKDRHNGNIMIDGFGCITHIDFGFLFDIDKSLPLGRGSTRGVKFEPSSFKLSHEMVVLMGGRNSIGFRQFSELTVKAFLACRPYGQAVVDTSSLMLAAEFPSFKGEPTMTRLAERFRLDLSETDAAEYMKGVIENACENPRSIVYDEFQRLTNGIPYVR